MRSNILLVLAGAMLASTAACSDSDERPTRSFEDPLPVRVEEDADRWVLVFDDEFDGPAIDRSKWASREGDLKHENTSILNTASAAMASVSDGSVKLSAALDPDPTKKEFPYTAARLETKGLFAQTYGKIEFRMRGQFAPGLWYAVWGRPWANAIPEIDVEFLAKNVSQAWFVNHWALPPLPADDRRAFVTVDGMDIREHHTYTVIWKPELVEWQIDGKAYMRATGRGVPHEPIYWIINTWVGGWGGKPNAATILPSYFEIDWFRVWRLADWLVEPSIRMTSARKTYAVDGEETINAEIADFDANAQVEVWEGDKLLETLQHPPFGFSPKKLTKAFHKLTFVGSDGTRRASVDADIYAE